MTDTQPKPKRHLRTALIALGTVTLLTVGGAGAFIVTFDPNMLKPRIRDAAREATGRDLALNGTIGMKFSLWPTVEVHDVALSNPPGFSRPNMATLQSLELRLGLIPLLSGRVEIERLVLMRPDIVLETNAQGEPNWELKPDRKPGQGGAGSAHPTPSKPPLFPHIAAADIKDGMLVWRDGGQTVSIAVPSLSVRADAAEAPLRIAADLRVNNAPLTIKAETGSLARLLREADRSPMPVNVTVTAGTATLKAEGTITDPARGKGYALAISAAIPDTATLGAVLPGITIPPARDIALSARITDGGGPLPQIAGLTLRTGAVTLPLDIGGLRIEKLDIAAPDITQPITVALSGRLDALPLSLTGTLGHPGFETPGAQPLPIDLRATAGDASITAKGTIAKLSELSGVAIALTARIPDLAALSPLARQPLPPFKTIAFQGNLADAAGGLTKGSALTGMILTLPEADLAGDVTVGLGKPLSITAALRSERIDTDALRTMLAKAEAAPAATAPQAATVQGAPPPARSDRLIPNDLIPFGLLRTLDADLRLRVGALRFDATDYKAIDGHLVIDDGKLRLDPFTAQAPEGRMMATLTADATRPAPLVHLTARSPGITLRGLLAAMGVRQVAAGQIEMHVDVTGAGETPRAIAASLTGMVGVAMASGTIDTRVLGGSVGKVSKDLALLDLLGRGGGTADIRCIAVRFDAQDGVARARTVLLSSSLLTADGGGSINLRDETMDLLLRPQGRVGGTGFRVPVKITGPWRGPRVEVDASGAAEANIDKLAGIVIGGDKQLGAVLGGLFGSDRVGNESNACPAALALARGGSAPPPEARESARPATATQPQQQQKPRLPDANTLFRQLFR